MLSGNILEDPSLDPKNHATPGVARHGYTPMVKWVETGEATEAWWILLRKEGGDVKVEGGDHKPEPVLCPFMYSHVQHARTEALGYLNGTFPSSFYCSH